MRSRPSLARRLLSDLQRSSERPQHTEHEIATERPEAAVAHRIEGSMRISTRFKVIAAVLLIMFLAPACQSMTGRSAGRYIDDKTITAKVKSKIVGEKTSNLTRVGVNTVNGVVHLDGVVDSVNDKVVAEEIARRVDGVTNVVNQLQISATGAASPR